jgi:hypothetical protein
MMFNHAAIPMIAFAEALFVTGIAAERKARSRAMRVALLGLGILGAFPGLLVLSDYTHLFGSPAWFYEFRTAAYSELTIAGIGFLARFSVFGDQTRGNRRKGYLANSPLRCHFTSLHQTHSRSDQPGFIADQLSRQSLPADDVLDLRSLICSEHFAFAWTRCVRAELGS